jgi:hypothetical protein
MMKTMNESTATHAVNGQVEFVIPGLNLDGLNLDGLDLYGECGKVSPSHKPQTEDPHLGAGKGF